MATSRSAESPLAPSYPWYTPYQFAGNKPIQNIDLDGLEESNATDEYSTYRAPSGNPISIPSNATPNYQNNSTAPVGSGSLTGFTLADGSVYNASYSKNGDVWNFDGYKSTQSFYGLFDYTKTYEEEREVTENRNTAIQAGMAIPLTLGVDFGIASGTATGFTSVTLSTVITTGAYIALPFLLTGDTRQVGYTGTGTISVPLVTPTDVGKLDYTFNIALGVDELLYPFSLNLAIQGIPAIPYNHSEQGWGLGSWGLEPYKLEATLIALGYLDNTKFHFNISSLSSKHLNLGAKPKGLTTLEFMLTYSLFRQKTTHWIKRNTAGTLYQRATEADVQKVLNSQ